jgi:hypothetical protein
MAGNVYEKRAPRETRWEKLRRDLRRYFSSGAYDDETLKPRYP